MTIFKVGTDEAKTGNSGEVLLISGPAMAMRMWQNEQPQIKAPHRSAYETLGYVVSGRAELIIEGHSVELNPGDSWLVPAHAEHSYQMEAFTAIECTSPPAAIS